MIPELEFYNSQQDVAFDEETLLDRLPKALEAVLAREPADNQPTLTELDLVEITILSDQAIGEVHGQFLDDPTPTDVITFPYGEILASVDTAEREASERGFPLERELLLYLIHGLLHLHGYDDHAPADRDEMHRIQGEILEQLWPHGELGIS